jgi:hypothetical protein
MHLGPLSQSHSLPPPHSSNTLYNSKAAEAVQAWQTDLKSPKPTTTATSNNNNNNNNTNVSNKKNSTKLAASIADPLKNPELFEEGWEEAMNREKGESDRRGGEEESEEDEDGDSEEDEESEEEDEE